jgi:hypothetical protein
MRMFDKLRNRLDVRAARQIAADPETMAAIAEAERELAAGETVPFRSVKYPPRGWED